MFDWHLIPYNAVTAAMEQVVNAVAHNQARLEIPDGLIGKLIAGMFKF